MDTEITELVKLDAERLDGVGSPANGTPWLLIKSAGDEKAADYDGDGSADADDEETEDKIEQNAGGNMSDKAKEAFARNAQRVKEKANKSDSQEADDIEEEVTGETVKELSAEERDAMPASKFAYVDPEGGKHLPVHDEGHVRAALGRFNQTDFSGAEDPAAAKAAAAAKITAAAKEHGIEVSDDSDVAEAAKKGAVQEALNGTDTPETSGTTIRSASGLAGPATAGVADMPNILAQDGRGPNTDAGVITRVDGGQSTYRIPAEAKINGPAVKHAATVLAAHDLAAFIQQLDEQRQDQNAVKADAATTDPGSAPWENLDSVTLQQVAQTLAHCGAAIDAIQKRETVEAMSGDPSDWFDSWDLMTVEDALDCALGITARLAYVEAAASQAAKSGDIDLERIATAHEDLSRTLQAGEQTIKAREGSTPSEEDIIVTEVTKEELAEAIIAGTESAVDARMDALKEQLGEIVAEAIKNANNGGDIDAADVKANGEVGDDLSGVAESVKPEYANKELADQVGEAVKAAVAAETAPLMELVGRMAKQARKGGPILDGQVRPDLARQEPVAKSEQDTEIEQLTKQMEQTTDPAVKAYLGEQLFLANRRKQNAEQFGR